MVNTAGKGGAVAGEGFLGQILSLAHLLVAIGEAAAGEADAEIGIRAEGMGDAELGVEIDGRDGEAQGKVGFEEVGLVIIEKSIGGGGGAPLERHIVAKLDEFAFDGVNLGKRGDRAESAQKKQGQKPLRRTGFQNKHAFFLSERDGGGKRLMSGRPLHRELVDWPTPWWY